MSSQAVSKTVISSSSTPVRSYPVSDNAVFPWWLEREAVWGFRGINTHDSNSGNFKAYSDGDLDKSFTDVVETTRASKAWEINESTGELKEFAVNEPRLIDGKDYIRPAATNLLLRSDDISVSPWVPYGGAQIDDAETVNLSASNDFIGQTVTQAVAVNDSISAGVELRGTIGQTVAVQITRVGGTFENSIARHTFVSSDWEKINVSHTFENAQTGYLLTIGRFSAADDATEINVRRAQSNVGANLAAFAPTESSQVTVAADTLVATDGRGPNVLTNTITTVGSPYLCTLVDGVYTIDRNNGGYTHPMASATFPTVAGATYEVTVNITALSHTARFGMDNPSDLSDFTTTGLKTWTFVAADSEAVFRATATAATNATVSFEVPTIKKVDPFPNFTSSGMGLAGYYGDQPGSSGDYFSATPTAAAASTTLVLRAYVSADDWTPSGTREIIGQWGGSDNGFIFRLGIAGYLACLVSTTGTDSATATTSAVTGIEDGAGSWVQAVVDVQNSTVTFQKSSDPYSTPQELVSNWVTIGTADRAFGSDISAGVNASQLAVQLGARDGTDIFAGKTLRVACIKDGTLNFDFNPGTDYSGSGATMTSSSTGEVWTANGNASFVGYGEGWFAFEFEVPSQTADANRYVFQMDDGAFTERLLALITTSGNVQCAAYTGSGTNGFVNTVGKVQPGTRHRVAVAYTATGLRMSLDRAAVVSATCTPNLATYTHLRLGHTLTGIQQLSGASDVFLTGSGTLTDAELQAL